MCEPRRKHLREKYTSELVLKLSKALSSRLGCTASFCVWNYKTARKSDPANLDPNYLFGSETQFSPFHTSLRKFKTKFLDRGVPCLHVDFHGKRDRKKQKKHNVDVGIRPWLEHPEEVQGWSYDDVDDLANCFAAEINTGFKGTRVTGKEVVGDTDPRLHGWWGDDEDEDDEECERTMTHQAVLLGGLCCFGVTSILVSLFLISSLSFSLSFFLSLSLSLSLYLPLSRTLYPPPPTPKAYPRFRPRIRDL